MTDIAVHEVEKYYGSNHVMKGITFEIFSGEKVGLLGRNGSGKTTLLKMMTGDEPIDSGNIFRASGKRIEMLAQIPAFGDPDTVEDVLLSSFKEIADVGAEMKKIEGDATPCVLSRYGRLMNEYERLGGYEAQTKLNKVCEGMKIDGETRKRPFNKLSGGEKTRVNLARILLRDCDILLLDEPTNHLDLMALEWLEKFLREFSGTVVVISHDRVFLDRVVTRIIEVVDGKASFYAGNYSFYVQEREQRFLTQAELYKQQQRKVRQLEAAIRRQRVWAEMNKSNTGLAKRALAMEKRLEQMNKVDRPVAAKKLSAEFDSGGYASKVIVTFAHAGKSYGDKILLDDLSLTIRRNDRIALVGANGCGKTTLLKMIMYEEAPDSGTVSVSPSVKAAYMPQIIAFDRKDATVLETLRLATGAPAEKARSILAGFHFRADDVMKKVGTLSGGEKSRLRLCMMMQNDVNFLLLDEPTNHLDIETREWIEAALSDFDGTMLFVSHDRFFLDKFADTVWSMAGGKIETCEYGFDEYVERARAEEEQARAAQKPVPKKAKRARAHPPASTESLIVEAEGALAEVNAKIEAESRVSSPAALEDLYAKRRRLAERIDTLYAKWMDEG